MSVAAERTSTPPGTSGTSRRGRRRRGMLAALGVAVVAALLATAWSAFPVERLASGSMAPAIRAGDLAVGVRTSGLPHRGDVVFFDDPGGWAAAIDRLQGTPGATAPRFVKRVIGLPGERVVCCVHGRMLIDGVPLAEPWLDGADAGALAFATTVPDGSLFVLGDARAQSLDSRRIRGDDGTGFVPIDAVDARVVAVLPFG